MSRLVFITHPEVAVDASRAVEDWSLSPVGIERATRFSTSAILQNVTHIWSSAERKAQDTAAILSKALNITPHTQAALGENDRSATGFLPPDQFEAAADAFFAKPETSFQGWETARAAQARIVNAVIQISANHNNGDLAIVSHGAVGTLLYCDCMGFGISRTYDQPHQGHYWTADIPKLNPLHGWRSIG